MKEGKIKSKKNEERSNNKNEQERMTKRKEQRRNIIMKKKKSERRNNFNSTWGTFWSRNRSPWLCSKQKPDRCEPQDMLRCSKAVPEVRG